MPAQSTSRSCGDSTSAKIVQYTSAPVLSRVIGPPDGPSFAGSLRVRSGLTISQLCPSSTERKTRLPAIHSSRGSQRE